MATELEPGEVSESARKPQIFVCKGLAVLRTRPRVAEPIEVCERRTVEEGDPVLQVHVEDEQRAAGLAPKRHTLGAIRVCDPLHAFTEGRSPNALLSSDAGLLHQYRGAKMRNMRHARRRSIE